MAIGDTAAVEVESPLTVAKITAAMDTVLATTLLSGPSLIVIPLAQGRGVIIAGHQNTVN